MRSIGAALLPLFVSLPVVAAIVAGALALVALGALALLRAAPPPASSDGAPR